ncbi:MAG: cob(I)yrinic acid a,c-diamide adenosyltransferase [Flavobacteriales bacterium]|nr:cob(I)yrinic acid a,c-diamide adenosyltransferase [Flavobacteriales bacterium]MCB9449133.1 cob(I)yrinic acid a,c-diamide adenosyltransferase [Flavobacteriales bacterium]
MKIYTKGGDQGNTALFGGSRLPKSHIRIEAYGTVDELNAVIGMMRDQEVAAACKEELVRIQDRLFTLGSQLATDPTKKNVKTPKVTQDDINFLEGKIDEMEGHLPPMKHFVLPGGHPAVSWCHLARCVCRRAERATVALNLQEQVDPLILVYLNRLSDYLFVLSRYWARLVHAEEMPWKPEL